MHILFLTDNFPPEGNAPASRTFEHACEWVKLGERVTVITGVPNFPEGKVFEGYRNKWYQTETVEGIDVIRVKTFITSNEGFLLRIVDYISFMFTGFIASLFVKKVDVLVATSPQFFTACAGFLSSVFKRVPFVFELRDIWPASITAVGAMRKSFAIKILEKMEMFLYRKADKIVCVTNSFKEELISRGVENTKISVVLNGVNLNVYQPRLVKDESLLKLWGLEDKFVVGYIGTHGMAHALDKVLECAELLIDTPQIQFLFVGGGAYKGELNDIIKAKNLTNVLSVDRQPKELMPRVWSILDVSLVCLKDADLFKTVIPSKIFESMGMGLPILLSAPKGEAADIVKSSNAGVVVLPEDPDMMRDAIVSLINSTELFADIKKASLNAASSYDRKSLAGIMLKELESLKNE